MSEDARPAEGAAAQGAPAKVRRTAAVPPAATADPQTAAFAPPVPGAAPLPAGLADAPPTATDDAIDRAQRAAAVASGRPLDDAPPREDYAGFVTRLVAFAVDVAIVDIVALVTGGVVALAASFFDVPSAVKAVMVAIGGVAFVIWTCAYFATFWSTTGQTPGSRVMQVRVIDPQGDPISPLRALRRLAGMVLAALPFFLGYLIILVDDDRRAFQDRLGGTVVVYAPRDKPQR